MYYRPREKKRGPFLTIILWVLLMAMTAVLVVMLSIYVGYVNYQPPTLADRFKPSPTPTRPAMLYVGDGDQYFAEGKLPQAIEAYQQAIRIDPNNAAPFIRQSRLLVYTRDTAKAVAQAEQAVLLDPTSPENLAYYCRALDWEARYGDAFEACSCTIELDPDYAEGYAFLSEVYADQGDWGSARTTAEQALEANFQSMHAHHNMGYALEVQGRYSEAVESYENAIKLAPKLAPLYVDAGRSYYWLGDYEQASDRFKQAIKLSPFDPEAYNWLGWTFYTIGESTQAIDALEQSIGVDPTFLSASRGTSAWGNLATVHYARQNFEEAIEFLPKAIELAENDFVRRIRRIEIYTSLETAVGSEAIPILRGEFVEITNRRQAVETIALQPIRYQADPEFGFAEGDELSCAASIVRRIKNEAPLLSSTQSLTETLAFSQAAGSATLDATTSTITLSLKDLPVRPTAGETYEIRVSFWPNRTDSVGFVQPDSTGAVQVEIPFMEKLSAPVEYYYALGLAYAYQDPPVCDQAIPWLLKSLEIDGSAYNPAWDGLKPSRCPTSNSPPTPIPTFTPIPEIGG